jgi:phage terminase Nu1 subunit (DNA packaging protein)
VHATVLKAGSDGRLLLNQRQVAQLLDVAPSTVARWPLEPAEVRGREKLYDPRAALAIRYGDGEQLDLGQERARLARVQTERQELELALRRGELLEAGEVQATWESLLYTCRARLLALPSTAAPRVSMADVHEARAILDDLVREALTELSKYDPEEDPSRPDERGGETTPKEGN